MRQYVLPLETWPLVLKHSSGYSVWCLTACMI